MSKEKLLTMDGVREATGMSRNAIYTFIKAGKFPPTVHILGLRGPEKKESEKKESGRKPYARWAESDVQRWIRAIIDLARDAGKAIEPPLWEEIQARDLSAETEPPLQRRRQ